MRAEPERPCNPLNPDIVCSPIPENDLEADDSAKCTFNGVPPCMPGCNGTCSIEDYPAGTTQLGVRYIGRELNTESNTVDRYPKH